MNIDISLTPKQSKAWDYLNDDITTEVLFGGSAGGGKSYLGCLFIIVSCIRYPGTRHLIGRSELKTLKASTLKTFFEVCKSMGLNSSHYNYNVMNSEITFYNGSLVILKDLAYKPSDPDYSELGGYELTSAFIDESNQVSELGKNILLSRIRYKLKTKDWDMIPKLFLSCNPSSGWLFREFYKKDRDGVLEDYKKFIPSLAMDNPHISPHYIENLKKMDEISKKRLLYGQWEYSNDMALMEYDKIINSFKDYEYRIDESDEFYISVDVARHGKDMAVILVWSGFKIIEIKSYEKSSLDYLKSEITKLKNKYGINNNRIIIDEDGVGGGLVDFMRGSKGFLNNGRPFKGENYQNLKTQCYYKLSEVVNNGELEIYNCGITEQEKITHELQIVQRKNVDKDGKLQILSKEEVKNHIGRSPDYSDTLMMRMYFEFTTSDIHFNFV